MSLKFVRYYRKYFYQCARLMHGTWNFHRYFENMKDKDIVYQTFLEGALMNSAYTDIIVDENEKVFGYLIASNTKQIPLFEKGKQLLLGIKFYIKQFCYLTAGKYGDKKVAYEQIKSLNKLTSRLEKDKRLFDSEVNLFFISPLLRGKGYGRKLMDRYIKYCRKRNMKKIFLWTDRGCNFKFYDHYGFRLHDQIHHKLLEEPEKEYNGFIYSMTLNE